MWWISLTHPSNWLSLYPSSSEMKPLFSVRRSIFSPTMRKGILRPWLDTSICLHGRKEIVVINTLLIRNSANLTIYVSGFHTICDYQRRNTSWIHPRVHRTRRVVYRNLLGLQYPTNPGRSECHPLWVWQSNYQILWEYTPLDITYVLIYTMIYFTYKKESFTKLYCDKTRVQGVQGCHNDTNQHNRETLVLESVITQYLLGKALVV